MIYKQGACIFNMPLNTKAVKRRKKMGNPNSREVALKILIELESGFSNGLSTYRHEECLDKAEYIIATALESAKREERKACSKILMDDLKEIRSNKIPRHGNTMEGRIADGLAYAIGRLDSLAEKEGQQ